MAIKHVWSVLCSRPMIDSQTNNINLLDVVEKISLEFSPVDVEKAKEINAEKAPKVLPYEYYLVNLWTKEGNEKSNRFKIKVEICDTTGKALKEDILETEIPQGLQRMRYILKLTHLFISSSGIYWFKISAKEEAKEYRLVAEIPLEIEVKVKKGGG